MKKPVIALILFMLAISSAYAQNVRSTFGNKDSTNEYAIVEKSDDIVYFRPTGGIKLPFEAATTTDTLTASESGRTYIVSPTNTMTFTLPTAAVGMYFKFMAAVGAGDGDKKIRIDPTSADNFRGVINNTQTIQTFSAGDALISEGATGDMVEIFCSVAGKWDVIDIRGSWTDDN